MIVLGRKVKLRAIEAADCDLLRDLVNDPETEYMLGGWSFPVSRSEQERWIETASCSATTFRAMIDAEDHTVGMAILSDIDYKNGTAQIHIKLCPDGSRHQGYGTDAVNALVSYAFSELRLHCVCAQISEHNIASQRLFEKCGFKREGLMRDRLFKRGRYINVLVYSKLDCDSRE